MIALSRLDNVVVDMEKETDKARRDSKSAQVAVNDGAPILYTSR